MELKRIELADVRPDPNNPRGDFGDIESLAASFELNPASPGDASAAEDDKEDQE